MMRPSVCESMSGFILQFNMKCDPVCDSYGLASEPCVYGVWVWSDPYEMD